MVMPVPASSHWTRSTRTKHDTVSLLRRSKNGDGAAREELFGRFYPPVFRIVRARVGPRLLRREQVEDLVQETLLRVFEGLETFQSRPDAHYIAYLAKVADRTIANRATYYGAQKRDSHGDVPLTFRTGPEGSDSRWDPVAQSTSISKKVALTEMEEILDECVAKLPSTYREVILMRRYAGANWAFMAQEFGRPTPEAAEQLYRRARMKLTRLVRKRIGDH